MEADLVGDVHVQLEVMLPTLSLLTVSSLTGT